MEGTREKLIAIIEEARREAVGTVGSMNNGFAVWYADKLLAAGVAPVVHGEWIPTKKHKWKTKKNGSVDEWAWDREFHNGPVCVICGSTPCMHCCPDYDEDEECDEHFVCSVCGRHEEEKHPYCHCGAKMDGGANGTA